MGNKTDVLSINRYIYANDNPLKYIDLSGFIPIYIQNQHTNNKDREPYIIKQGDDQYFIRNGAEPVYSKNGNNYYITSGNIEVKEMPQAKFSGITTIAPPGYKDNSPYAIDNIYKLPTLNIPNPNTTITPPKENQLGNFTVITGVGLGGNVKINNTLSVSAQMRYAGEKDMLYNHEFRGVLNTEVKILGTGVSLNHDYINKRIYDNYSLLSINKNGNDIIWNYGIELYVGGGGGFSGYINLSEIMRRIEKISSQIKCKYE